MSVKFLNGACIFLEEHPIMAESECREHKSYIHHQFNHAGFCRECGKHMARVLDAVGLLYADEKLALENEKILTAGLEKLLNESRQENVRLKAAISKHNEEITDLEHEARDSARAAAAEVRWEHEERERGGY